VQIKSQRTEQKRTEKKRMKACGKKLGQNKQKTEHFESELKNKPKP